MRIKKYFKRIMLGLCLILIILGILGYVTLSKQVKQVKAWEPIVEEITQSYNIEGYSDLILAIIFTESKGNHLDLMQSSESKYGARNQITTSEESIETGAAYLSELVYYANERNSDLWTAVQAYNFGKNYIDYVADRGGIDTLDMAESYSKNVLAPMLGNETGEMYTYKHPLALWHNGGKLYRNGGNFYYAETVKWYLNVLKRFR